jgi:hypothetical protein
MSLSRIGILLLAIWLILFGLSGFINLGDLQMLLNVIAVIAGILLLISR